MAAVMGATVLLVLVAPAPFDALPAPFAVRHNDPPWLQVRAALLGGAACAVTFLSSFTLYAIWYIRRQRALVFMLISCWMAASIGGPLTLLLIRSAARLAVPIDVVTLVFVVANLALPGTVLVWWHATRVRFALCRRLHAAALSTLCAWLLSYLPFPTLVAVFGTLAFLDIVLVALPCCSPVQTLDKLYHRRAAQGEPAMPGLTFYDPDPNATDGLFLGLGDFIVFSVFCGHTVLHIGWQPLSAVATGLLAGLVILMVHVSLKWPLRALEPAIPLSVVLAALLLLAERFALKPLSDGLALASCGTL